MIGLKTVFSDVVMERVGVEVIVFSVSLPLVIAWEVFKVVMVSGARETSVELELGFEITVLDAKALESICPEDAVVIAKLQFSPRHPSLQMQV